MFEHKFGGILGNKITFDGEAVYVGKARIDLDHIVNIFYSEPTTFLDGFVFFSKSGEPPKGEMAISMFGFRYPKKQNEQALELLTILSEHAEVKSFNIVNSEQPIPLKQNKNRKEVTRGLRCPKCKSTTVQLIGTDVNIKKTKTSTSVNLNPLKPLTIFNHKDKKKKKRSKGKVAAALLTGGTSMLVTGGTKDNKGREFSCAECGTVFKTK